MDDKAHAFSNAHLFLFHLSNFYLYTRHDTYTPWQMRKWKWKTNSFLSFYNVISIVIVRLWTGSMFVEHLSNVSMIVRVCVCWCIYTISLLSQIRYGVVLLNTMFLIYKNSVQITQYGLVLVLLSLGGRSTCKLKRIFSLLFITEQKMRTYIITPFLVQHILRTPWTKIKIKTKKQQ